MVKNTKIYVGFLLILSWIVVDTIIGGQYMVSVLGVLGIGLIVYQLRINEDVRIVIVRNKIIRKFERKPLQDYYVLFLEITNLSTYSQYYDLTLADKLLKEAHTLLKKTYPDVFLYSPEQLVIFLEFQHKTVINQRLRVDEQQQIAQRIRTVFEQHKFHAKENNQYHHLTCTIGAGSMGIRGHYDTVSDLIKLAHFAMLKAKESSQSMLIASEETRLIKEDVDTFYLELEHGLEEDEIVPHFLPIVDPHSMRVIGCESLLRWEQNEYRIIEASKFKQVAIEKNLFEQLDLTIIRKSFESYQTWLKDDLIDDDFTLTLNVGMNTLRTINAHELLRMATAHQIDPRHVELDISEHDLTSDHTFHVIQELRKFGFRVSIDAFNSNNTILDAISRVSIDTIKLDRVILPININDTSRMQFYRMIVKLSRFLGYQTMAKGVENKNQLELAKELQVDYIQGYYITPPLNDTKIRGFLNKYHRSVLV